MSATTNTCNLCYIQVIEKNTNNYQRYLVSKKWELIFNISEYAYLQVPGILVYLNGSLPAPAGWNTNNGVADPQKPNWPPVNLNVVTYDQAIHIITWQNKILYEHNWTTIPTLSTVVAAPDAIRMLYDYNWPWQHTTPTLATVVNKLIPSS
jgi:hypothetical protein